MTVPVVHNLSREKEQITLKLNNKIIIFRSFCKYSWSATKCHVPFMPDWFCLYLYIDTNPFRKWRIYSKVKMLNCIFGDQVKKQNFSTFHLHIPEILVTVELRFNEVAGDRPNLFVKWRVCCIENLDITNLRGNDPNVRYIEVIVND